MSKSKGDYEQLIKDKNDLERQYFDYKIKSVSGKFPGFKFSKSSGKLEA